MSGKPEVEKVGLKAIVDPEWHKAAPGIYFKPVQEAGQAHITEDKLKHLISLLSQGVVDPQAYKAQHARLPMPRHTWNAKLYYEDGFRFDDEVIAVQADPQGRPPREIVKAVSSPVTWWEHDPPNPYAPSFTTLVFELVEAQDNGVARYRLRSS